MTTEQIFESNEMIAEFIGMKKSKYNQWCFKEQYVCIEGEDYADYWHIELKFNLKWDKWLMPVIEKVESIYDDFHGYFGVYIHSNCCTIQGSKLNTSVENYHPAYFLESYGDTKIEAVYLAVIQFIKFWNDQKRKDSQREKS